MGVIETESVATCKCIFEEDFASTLEAMGEVLNHAVAALREHDCIESGQEFAARLCLEEALVNAIKHGNKNDQDRRVRLAISKEGDTCRVAVQDEGEGFEPDKVVVPDCEQESGRGICIICHYMDHVEFDPAQHSLIMQFRQKSLGKGA